MADTPAESGAAQKVLGLAAARLARDPSDHRARREGADALLSMGDWDGAVTAHLAAAEGLLHWGYLLASTAAVRRALDIDAQIPAAFAVLKRIHARSAPDAPGRCLVPPPQGSWAHTPPPLSEVSADARAALLAPDGTAPALLQGEKQPLPLFALLPEAAFVELARRMKVVERRPGDKLVGEGETGDALYMLVSGNARVEKGGERVARLREGAIFGDLAVLFHRPRNATVVADTDVELFEITRDALAALDCPEALETFARRRTVTAVLASSPLFRRIPDDERKLLAERFRAKAFDAGERMVERGTEPPGLYIIVDGEAEVTADGRTVARLKEMDTFGEVSLLRHGNATATVTAARATACALIPRDEFLNLSLRWPEVRRELLFVSLERLQSLLTAPRSETDGEAISL